MVWFRFETIKRALDSEDIEGLFAHGCPKDEYSGEASLIESELASQSDFGKRMLTIEEVAQIIAEVWDREFGPLAKEDLERRRPSFQRVAAAIQR